MALANSCVQEVDGSHENPNANYYQVLDHHHHHQNQMQMSQTLINFNCGNIDNLNFHKNNESLMSFEPQGVCGDGSVYEWLLYSEAAVVSDAIHEAQPAPEFVDQKRALSGESSGGVCKKQCSDAGKKQKPKSSTGKDQVQSIAAKNRRERISERLKMLQELVPNGSKVDLVTMLEKAISYVKFLQLQVKILATDEFWAAQDGKVADISQVKEAVDVILLSQRERSSNPPMYPSATA